MKITSLGYLRVESPDAKEWLTFGTEILGMATTDDPLGRPDVVSLTNDDRPGRLTIAERPTDRLQCVGWEVPNAEELARAANELRAAGVIVTDATAEQRRVAQVRDLVTFSDPAGFTHELFYGPLVLPGSFRPGRAMSGFVTGSQGPGHIVLVVPELKESLAFFRDVLGFRVSDEIDTAGGPAIFFHVNSRHHSLAILAMTMGRHTNDHMMSFYVRSPSGFEIEYGWGAALVPDADDWVVTHMTTTSIWGHRPGTAPPPGCLEPVSHPAVV